MDSRHVHDLAALVVADVAGDDRQGAAAVGDAAVCGGVAADGDAGDRQTAAIVEDPAAILHGGVVAERAAGDGQEAAIGDAAAIGERLPVKVQPLTVAVPTL